MTFELEEKWNFVLAKDFWSNSYYLLSNRSSSVIYPVTIRRIEDAFQKGAFPLMTVTADAN